MIKWADMCSMSVFYVILVLQVILYMVELYKMYIFSGNSKLNNICHNFDIRHCEVLVISGYEA